MQKSLILISVNYDMKSRDILKGNFLTADINDSSSIAKQPADLCIDYV